MCGITGFIDYTKKSSEDLANIMSNTLAHRGPNGSGVFFSEEADYQISFAHRRLSIIELSELGKQPMYYKHLCITFNGEIYNYQEIKSELLNLGHSFISNSDTEVILQAFYRWGIDCVHRFIGMFAFSIYDSLKKEVICVRDRAGVKPFFYYFDAGLFMFSSELKAFHKHPSFKKQLDVSSIASFMQFGNIPAPFCIFKNCFKLMPGHYLRFQLSTRAIKTEKYWDVYDYYNKPKLSISFSDAKKETEKILTSAAEYRMIADVPVGIFLSGGIDSTCLTALLQKNSSRKLNTFTIGVNDGKYNEAHYAKVIAQHLGTNHEEYYCSESDALEIIPSLPYYYDEPFADPSAIPSILVSKLAKSHVSVALSADGGDEIFAGYNRYARIMKHGKFLNQLPSAVKYAALKGFNLIPTKHIFALNQTASYTQKLKKLKEVLKDSSYKNIMLQLSTQFSENDLDSLFLNEVSKQESSIFNDDLKEEFYTPLSYIMAVDYQSYLADDIFQKVDRASMSEGLEAREPFIDNRIIEWSAQLPDEYKYHNHVKKHILKEIVYQYIPEKTMNRPKMGFSIPLSLWLENDLKPLVEHYLSAERITSQNIFSTEQVTHLKNNFYAGKKDSTGIIWHFLMFQMWYEKWMD